MDNRYFIGQDGNRHLRFAEARNSYNHYNEMRRLILYGAIIAVGFIGAAQAARRFDQAYPGTIDKKIEQVKKDCGELVSRVTK